MQNAGRNQPAGAGFEAIGAAEIKNAVVAFVPILQALANLRARRAGFESHEGVRKIVAHVVVLRRKIVGLRLAFQAEQRGLFGVLVHVMWNRPHVVKKLRVDRPLFVFAPDFIADEGGTAFADRLLQGEALPARDDIAETFIRGAIIVGGGGGGTEPAFVNAAAI